MGHRRNCKKARRIVRQIAETGNVPALPPTLAPLVQRELKTEMDAQEDVLDRLLRRTTP